VVTVAGGTQAVGTWGRKKKGKKKGECVGFRLITWDVSHSEMLLMNTSPLNMSDMFVTWDVFQLERSLLNRVAPLNILDVVVNLGVSHLEMLP